MEQGSFVAGFVIFLAGTIFVLLLEIAQFNAGLIIFIPDPGRAHDGAKRLKIGVRAGLVAVDIITKGVNDGVRHNDVITQIGFPLRGQANGGAVGMIAIVSAVECGIRAGSRIAREAAGDGVICQQEGKFVKSAVIKFLR